MTLNAEHIFKLKAVMDAVVETVAESGPHGAPGGVLYAALMQYGCTLDTFEKIMEALVQAGRLERHGHLYFPARPR